VRGPPPHPLTVENGQAAARVLRILLEAAGYRVTLAADGAAARRHLDEEGAPDLLLLDWMLPGISGLELCHYARQRWDPLRLPILMVTARADPESVYAAFDAGASDYVQKPFRGAELRARIDAHLRTARLHAERERMEEHLRERDKLFTLGLLAGGVAHDLNNPLAVIRAHAQLLERRAADGESAEQLRAIQEAVDRCTRIVSGLLDFARRHPARYADLDLAEVVRAALALREKRLASVGVAVEVELPDGLPRIHGDAHPLQQLLLNLLVNAEQALEESGGKLRVSSRLAPRGTAVEVEVWNDGPRIAPDVLERVFEPLFTTKPGDRGTGLGLFIGRRIAHEHGGDLVARSDDGGTSFTVRIPVVAG
jgi:signal transduction histidine kinase